MKNSLMAAALWLSPLPARAQPELDISLKGGANMATLAHENRFNIHGFSGGLAGHLRWALVERFSLAGQLEVLYSPRGAKIIFEGEYLGRDREHYLDFTVAARPGVRFGRASLYLLLGGGLDVL